MATGGLLLEEEQRFRQVWIWVLMFLCCVAPLGLVTHGLYGAFFLGKDLQGKEHTTGELLLIGGLCYFFCLGLLWLMYAMRLTVRVDARALRIRFFPLIKKQIPHSEITRVEACTYRPLLHYGGWGIRYGMGRGWCYNVSGNHGVKLELANGKKLLIGSQRAEAFADALRRAKGDGTMRKN